MPASGAIKLADDNVWLAVAFSDHAHHAKAKVWFDAQPDGTCAFCRVTQMALLRHLTNSKIMGRFVQSQQEVWKNYEKSHSWVIRSGTIRSVATMILPGRLRSKHA